MAPHEKLPKVGWTPLWSKDRTTLVQLVRDLETGSIVAAWVAHRKATWSTWEPLTELETEWESVWSPA